MTGCDPLRVSAYYDGELPGWQRREFERHLAECADCARRLTEYRTIGAGIRALPDVAPPAVIRMRVFSRLPRTQRERDRPPHRSLLVGAGALAMAAVLVMTLAALFNGLVERPAAPGSQPETARQAAPTSPPAELAMKAEPTTAPAPADSRPAAPKPATSAPPAAVKPAATPRPTSAAPAAATPAPSPTAPKPSPTVAAQPTAAVIVQATVAPTPANRGLLGQDPTTVLTPTSAITITGVISDVVRGQQLTLRAEDGNTWQVGLTATETITRTDGLMASMNDLRPGLRIGIVGRPSGSVRSVIARVLTIFAP